MHSKAFQTFAGHTFFSKRAPNGEFCVGFQVDDGLYGITRSMRALV